MSEFKTFRGQIKLQHNSYSKLCKHSEILSPKPIPHLHVLFAKVHAPECPRNREGYQAELHDFWKRQERSLQNIEDCGDGLSYPNFQGTGPQLLEMGKSSITPFIPIAKFKAFFDQLVIIKMWSKWVKGRSVPNSSTRPVCLCAMFE